MSVPASNSNSSPSLSDVANTYEEQLETWYGKCLQNPKWSDKVQLVSLEWLKSIANPNPSAMTDLGVERKSASGELVQVDMAQLSRDLKKNGVQEPLIVQYGLQTKRARLEAGNHRVQILLDAGLMHAPCVLYVAATHQGNVSNGDHEGASVLAYDVSNQVVSVGPYTESKFCAIGGVLPSAPLYTGKLQVVGAQVLKKDSSVPIQEPVVPTEVPSPMVTVPVRARKVRSDKGKSKEGSAAPVSVGSVGGLVDQTGSQSLEQLWDQ